jgi:hypothetical protein
MFTKAFPREVSYNLAVSVLKANLVWGFAWLARQVVKKTTKKAVFMRK